MCIDSLSGANWYELRFEVSFVINHYVFVERHIFLGNKILLTRAVHNTANGFLRCSRSH